MSQEKKPSILDRLKKFQPNAYKKTDIKTADDRKHFKKQDRGMDLYKNLGKNSTKMVSDRDKKGNSEKGKIKDKLEKGGVKYVSSSKFKDMYGAGKRTLSSEEGTLEGGVKATRIRNGWKLKKEEFKMSYLESVVDQINQLLEEGDVD